MKIFYLYIARKFWGPFFFGLSLFAVLVLLADLFEKLKYIMKNDVPLAVALKYFLLVIPFWTLMVVPVAVLLAALFVLSEMINNGEWVAAISSGYKPLQIFAPLIVCSAIVAGANFILQETVGPMMRRSSTIIFDRDIAQKKDWSKSIKKDIVLKAGDGVFLSVRLFDGKQGTMERVVMDVNKDGRTAFQLDAQNSSWNPQIERWIFYNGVERVFTSQGHMTERVFKQKVSDISIPPRDMVTERVWQEDLTIADIRKRISALNKIGAPTQREEVFLNAKIAAPFANIIICLLGIPFALVIRKSNKMLHFALAIGIAFLFWWLLSISQSAGEAGFISPVVSAWLPVAIFGAISIAGIRKTST